MINAPVLHVNGDHPEDGVRAIDIAFRYRKYFRKDIIIDLLVWCIPQLTHNELDLPSITSPLMYEKISARRSVPQIYEEKLKTEEILNETDITEVCTAYKSHLEAELSKGIVWPASKEAEFDPVTGVDQETLTKVGKASVAVPDGFEVHSKLHRHIKNPEAMAFGSLMLEGCDVRILGQDVGRGTFSQRHAMLVNQQTEGVIVPLNDELQAPGTLELAIVH
ncbi:hypothetical protein D9615_006975 [Tricholomella constricta]|uniref:Dehydrogenase E1 component domain-containing protein n=1 Tax=Tricholomella constricta TaxID=117010 RepID=A0A8H5H8P9_9AGAR|nr:hypothetical protein D9615_006975 [Tricholomella constricta]